MGQGAEEDGGTDQRPPGLLHVGGVLRLGVSIHELSDASSLLGC